ncbi:MAG TPA: hypothetical protein VEF55_09130 [Candidatus Binatia bacterium]|nr:hypothetical protein [Candidatus Binatia bacterium]
MRTFVSMIAITAALAMTPAAAQDYEAMAAEMEQSMAEAQAAAVRPGDDQLTCEQLESEMVASMQDPAVQSVVAQNGAWAQGQLDQMNAAQGQMRAQMATSMFMGIVGSFIPGFGYAQMAQQQMMAAQQQRQAEQNMAQMMEMGQRMQTIMPQMMRGQRLYELGQSKQCAFVQQQAAPQN